MPLSLPVFRSLSSALERAEKFYEGEIVAAGKLYGMEVTSFAPRSLQIPELVWDRMKVCTSCLSYLEVLVSLWLSGLVQKASRGCDRSWSFYETA